MTTIAFARPDFLIRFRYWLLMRRNHHIWYGAR